MKTLKGVIAASTYAEYETPLADSNLFIYPWYFTLSSGLYAIEFEDAIAPSMVEPSADRRTVLKNFYMDDAMGIAMLAPSVYRRSFPVYDKAEPESLAVAMLAPAVSRRNHPAYAIPEESMAIAMLAPSVTRTNT